ncbi:MAG: zinc ribbon domain-containing protein [Desulfobacterales bacterium]|nr:zinc ribbon domain-containing protein [Desulfobacterales bacterium]
MPIFEYQCEKCNADFEKLVFSSDDQSPECPECNSQEVMKKMSATSLTRSSNCTPKGSGGFS